MVKPTSLKWVDDWYGAIAADLVNQEFGQGFELTPVELHRRVQDYILDALCGEIHEKYGVSLPGFVHPKKPAHRIGSPPIPCISANRLGEIYEQVLSHNPIDKKTGGAYYTPTQLVDFVVENTVRVWTEELPTVLDPACGGGFFLLAAYQELLDGRSQTMGRSLTRAEREQILLDCIHGVDINPHAVTVTKLSLLLKLLENQPPSQQPLPDLSHNIYCGNAVIGEDFEWDDSSQSNPLSWQKAFPNIFQSGGFNIVIGNPPYVDSEWMTKYLPGWRQYCASRYKSATGNWDLFCVFIEKALMLCRPNGLISLVVPNKLASADYASGARSLLTTASQIITLHDYSQSAAFGAAVYPLVFVARKRTGQPDQHQLDQQEPGAVWAIAATVQQSQLLDRLRDHFPKLEAIAQVNGAATVAEAYAMQELIQEGQPQEEGQSHNHLRMVNSGTIDRYCFLWGKKPMRYLGQTYLQPVIVKSDRLPPKRLQQAKQPKIIVSGMTKRLECALDRDGSFLAGKSTSIIFSSQTCDLYYLLGVLNSRLISFYLKSYFSGNSLKGNYLRIGSPQLRQIPICLSEDSTLMIKLVRQRLTETIPSQLQMLDHKIDQLVYQLYGLTDLEIQIVEQAKL
jgi:N-6 DNA Methylase/TaqI-like C-terminal specificity domain